MAIEKRVPMAGNMEKVATEDLLSENNPVYSHEGSGWTITLNLKQDFADEMGEDSVSEMFNDIVELIKSFEAKKKE